MSSESAAADFGTRLRAHLGLERAQLDVVAEPTMPPEPAAAAAAAPATGLNAAQALYDEVLGSPSPHDDELGRLRRRKSVA